MYDALTSTVHIRVPERGESRVALSAFRTLEPLAGTAHPVVYRIRFACPCGDEHDGLVSHDELDWAPLGLDSGVFLNLMTSRVEPVAAELGELAAARIEAGSGPGASSAIRRSGRGRCSRRRSSCSPQATARSASRCAARPAGGRR